MLTTDRWYRDVPKEPQANWAFRRALLERCRTSATARRDVKIACSQDILFYVNAFAWTHDPRSSEDKGTALMDSREIPFITYGFQDRALVKLVECIHKGKDCVIEKSRDMGASWLCLMAFEWLWRYGRGFTFLMLSRNELLVEKPGDMKALFSKIDFLQALHPKWLMPRMERRKHNMVNLDGGCTIDGETSASSASVGDRRTAVLLDEFSRMENADDILSGSADVTDCRIFNFTPWGTSNAAFELTQKPGVEKLRLHWSEHPVKSRGLYRWEQGKDREILDTSYFFPPDYKFIQDGKLRSVEYDKQELRRNPQEMAQHWDIDYLNSRTGFYEENTIRVLIEEYARDPVWEGEIACDEETAVPDRLMESENGNIKLWIRPDSSGRPPRARMYAVGCDIATGVGATPSVATILDCGTGEKVLEYATGFLKPERFAVHVVALCRLFLSNQGDPAKLCWEANGPGNVFGKKVLEIGYRNCWKRVNEFSARPSATDQYGWYPSPENKELAHSEYRAALATRQFLNPSAQALRETLDFFRGDDGYLCHKNDKGRVNALNTGNMEVRQNHGDRVVADMLAWKLCKEIGLVGTAVSRERKEIPVNCIAWRRERKARMLAGIDRDTRMYQL